MRYVGIDPGLTGAIAVLDVGQSGTIYWGLHDMPVTKLDSGKREVNPIELTAIFMREIGRCSSAVICVEKVFAAPIQGRQQGSVGMFRFGESFGIVRGVLSGLQIPYHLVSPQRWKAGVGLLGLKGKESSIIKAKAMYPECGKSLTRKKDHGRADALLLAHYAKTFLKPTGTQPISRFDRIGIALPF